MAVKGKPNRAPASLPRPPVPSGPAVSTSAGSPRSAPGPGPAASPPPGPWYTCGLGGQLLATNALAFGLLVALTYAFGLALLAALLSLLLLLLCGCAWPCNVVCSSGCGGGSCCGSSGAGGGTCCSGSASTSQSAGHGCCGGSASASGSGSSSGGCCSGSGSASGGAHVGSTSAGASVGAPGGGVAAVAGTALGSAWLRARGGLLPARDAFAHHPDAPAFAQDVFRIRGWRLCVGCTTVLPAFLLPSAGLALRPIAPWWLGLVVGVPLAALQAFSSAGLARRRWQKVAVKTALGVGLALVVAGTLSAPWPRAAKVALLAALLLLAFLSTLPRRRRLQSWTSGP
jgi:hypothetical protein